MALNSRGLLFGIAGLCMAALGFALISQYGFGMQPCAWCVLQRLIYLLIALFALLGAWAGKDRPGLRHSMAIVSGLAALGGMVAAWYQHSVASQSFSCDLTFADRFMVGIGLDSGVPWLFGIFATCMDARVAILGVEYAVWSLLLFGLIAILSLLALLGRR